MSFNAESTIEQIPFIDATSLVTDFVANGSFASLKENVTYLNKPSHAVLIRLVDFNADFQKEFVWVDEKSYKFLRKSSVVHGDVIISNVGANAGTVFRAPNLNYPMTLGPNSVLVRSKTSNDFLYYWLISPLGQAALKSILSGSAQPKFNKTDLRKIYVPNPAPEIQRDIAQIPLAIDKKIELNQKINETLEEVGQTLFKNYFINNLDSHSWGECKISDFAEQIKSIEQPQKNLGKSYSHYSIPAFDNSRSPEIVFGSEIKSNKYGVRNGSILVSKLNPGTPRIWPIIKVQENAICSTEFQVIVPHKYFSFLYYLLTSRAYSDSMTAAAGGTSNSHKRVSPDYILAFQFKKPPADLLDKFENATYLNLMRICANISENQNLSELRDSLLPRLMSGKMRI